MGRFFLLFGVLPAVLVLAAIGGIAIAGAQNSSEDGVISGCYLNSSGLLRIVSETSECRRSETPISWNQEGPPGSVSVGHVSYGERLEPGETHSVTAYCPSPTVVTGGGFEIVVADGFDSPGEVNVLESVPERANGRLGNWRVTAVNNGPETVILFAHAVCAPGPSS
jgi:hypothetical protein